MSDPLLSIKHLGVRFYTDDGELTAVQDVSFDLHHNEILGIVGESGCGKSVSNMSILRLIPRPMGDIHTGEIIFNGKDLLSIPIKELRGIRGKDIGVIFQEPMTALSPLKRIGHQMVEALRVHSDMGKAEAWKISEDWLKKVGIPDPEQRMFDYPYQFSGGMRQRAMIAMVLMMNPKVIIADEPTTALDVTIQAQVFDLIREMKDQDSSMILITHDMGVIWEMCDRVIVMYAAQVVENAPAKDIFKKPLHPYTSGLLASVPNLAIKQERLNTIEGQVPSPLHYPVGCHFADRCEFAMDKCREKMPELIDLPDGRQVRCFKVEDEQ
ncbi:MAG: ABC transporter ATP-binding protein [Lentisphaeria bacterium]|nr:ABC transporter ATP-binding protein [Lentisphaeria bacterium]